MPDIFQDAAITLPPKACDTCAAPIDLYFCDASLPAFGGQWANVCPVCAAKYGVRYGVGLGQKYMRQPDGFLTSATHLPSDRFVKVAG